MPKVSVIVPVYNTAEYLERCLDALVNQTLTDIEIIAVNDGSTDQSPQILEDYAGRYSNLLIINKENGGQAAARNLGIKESTGEYIGFADSDDYIDRTMFEKMYCLAKDRDCDMVECHFHFLMENPGGGIKELSPRGRVREYTDQHDMMIDPQVSPWNKLFRREVLMQQDVEFPEGLIYEDTAFYIKAIPYVKTSAYLDEKLVYYFLRGSSTINANKSKKVGDIFPVLENILEFYKRYGFYQEYKEELEYFCVKIALCSSLSRIGRVTDKDLSRQLLDQTFAFIRKYFPDYKKNPKITGKTGFYMKHVSRRNSRVIAALLGRVMKG